MIIKYALIKIQEWVQEEKRYKKSGYVVSKCYVLYESTECLKNGQEKIYGVVFPYKYKSQIKPEFDTFGKCTNKTFVKEIFDTYEEAKKRRKEKNDKLFQEKMRIESRKKIQLREKQIEKLEKEIEENTKDLNVTVEMNHASILERIPSEIFLKLYSILTPQEKEYLKEQIKSRSCRNCTNGSCRVESYEKNNLDEMENPAGYQCIGWRNEEEIGKQLLRKKRESV